VRKHIAVARDRGLVPSDLIREGLSRVLQLIGFAVDRIGVDFDAGDELIVEGVQHGRGQRFTCTEKLADTLRQPGIHSGAIGKPGFIGPRCRHDAVPLHFGPDGATQLADECNAVGRRPSRGRIFGLRQVFQHHVSLRLESAMNYHTLHGFPFG